jgi:hypothetical protein
MVLMAIPSTTRCAATNTGVYFRGQWLEVEERAVKHQHNPVGEGAAWFYFVDGDLTCDASCPARVDKILDSNFRRQ